MGHRGLEKRDLKMGILVVCVLYIIIEGKVTLFES